MKARTAITMALAAVAGIVFYVAIVLLGMHTDMASDDDYNPENPDCVTPQ